MTKRAESLFVIGNVIVHALSIINSIILSFVTYKATKIRYNIKDWVMCYGR